MRRQAMMEGFERPPRARPRVMAKLADAGPSPIADCKTIARYECRACGWDSGWRDDNRSDSQIKRGLPCEVCNKPGVSTDAA